MEGIIDDASFDLIFAIYILILSFGLNTSVDCGSLMYGLVKNYSEVTFEARYAELVVSGLVLAEFWPISHPESNALLLSKDLPSI